MSHVNYAIEWLLYHRDAIVLTAICGVVLAATYVPTEYLLKKALKVPYK